MNAAIEATGSLITVFAGPGGRTWTALAMLPGGLACITSHGTNWQAVSPNEEPAT